MPTTMSYTVQRNDTLGAIAFRYGITVEALVVLNGLADADRISVGQVLQIPSALSAPLSGINPQDRFGPENLAMAPVNEIYRDAILAASARTGLAPQTTAAIIDAEAAKLRSGQWHAASQAATSSAAGLTQFLEKTWRELVRRPGGILNGEARSRGLLNAANQIINDVSVLALRLDPGLSILAGAEFAIWNLAQLRNRGVVGDLEPASQAKIAYLAHHEGVTGAANFLRGLMGYVTEQTFRANITRAADRDRWLSQAGGNTGRAYRDWLSSYINRKIDVRRFMRNAEDVIVPDLKQFFL